MQKTISGIAVFALAAALAQQQPKPQQQAQQTGAQNTAAQSTNTGDVKFSASAHLVIEDVTVKDKNGKTIEGLKAEDFTVTEDGKPQTISFCTYQNLPDYSRRRAGHAAAAPRYGSRRSDVEPDLARSAGRSAL